MQLRPPSRAHVGAKLVRYAPRSFASLVASRRLTSSVATTKVRFTLIGSESSQMPNLELWTGRRMAHSSFPAHSLQGCTDGACSISTSSLNTIMSAVSAVKDVACRQRVASCWKASPRPELWLAPSAASCPRAAEPGTVRGPPTRLAVQLPQAALVSRPAAFLVERVAAVLLAAVALASPRRLAGPARLTSASTLSNLQLAPARLAAQAAFFLSFLPCLSSA